jgi:hypothetical protein
MPTPEAERLQIAPTLDTPLRVGSLLFCATLRLAWAELAKITGQHPLRLQGDPPIAVALEGARVSADDLDPRSYVARAGVGDEGLRAIRKAVHAAFGDDAKTELLPRHLRETELLAYAILLKDLLFATPFAPGEERGMAFSGGPRVRYFSLGAPSDAAWEARAKQITVHDHRSDDDFVLELASRDPEDRLIVARCPPAATLGETVRGALDRAARSPSLLARFTGDTRIRPDEPLQIPLVEVHVEKEFESLATGIVGTDWAITSATQVIRFNLDETGARLRSEAAILAARGGRRPKRRFVCDGPFLVVLARRGRTEPYFASWIAGTEALCPALVTT